MWLRMKKKETVAQSAAETKAESVADESTTDTPADPVPAGLRIAADVAWRGLVLAAAGWVLLRILGAVSVVLIPLAVALLLTALLMPIAARLNRRLRMPRHAAAAVTLIGFLATIIGVVALTGTQLANGLGDLGPQVTAGLNKIQDWLANGPLGISGDQINEWVGKAREWVKNNNATLATGAVHAGQTAGEFLVGTIMMLFALFFFLSEGDRIWAWLMRLLPRQVQTPLHESFRRGWVTLSSYVKTQVLVAAIDAVGITIGVAVLGLPLLAPIFLIVFIASVVPIVGAVVSGIVVVAVALVTKGVVAALIMLAVVVGVQQIESHLLQPLLMSKSVSVHPLATIMGISVGSYLLGVLGALFAVPVLAVINTVVLYLRGYDKFPRLAHGHSAVGTSAKKLAVDDQREAEREEEAELTDHPVGAVTPQVVAADRQAEEAATQRAATTPEKAK